tara:strand:+ start:10069 stop:12120 length:2052 start_codon:yes stop_codon:yes gene_type:complete
MKLRKTNKLLLSFLLASSFLMGCDENPYPAGDGVIVETPTLEEEPLPELSLAVDDVIEFREGRRGTYLIRGAVAEPGEPIISVEDLPAGATFDEKENLIKWIPDHFAGNDPNDPGIKSRIYPIMVELRSSEDEFRAVRKQVNLLVHDVPQLIKINTARNGSIDEGKKFSSSFTIENSDYPDGPFKVLLKDMPANIELIADEDDPTKFTMEFTPDFFHVNRETDGQKVKYVGTIFVSNPANHIEEKQFEITVNDIRLDSKLVAPSELVQGLDVSIQVAGYDLNKEVTPKIELLGGRADRPQFGTFDFEVIKNPENYSSVLNVTWKDIPPSQNGKTHTLKFKSCVLSFNGSYNNCSYAETEVKFVVRDRKAPLISRSSWPVDELVYIGFNEKLSKNIRVTDREDSKLSPKVEIFPEEMRQYVEWDNGFLTARFDKAGVYQFNLKATSDYNVSSTESFILEVFPEERYKNLIFADSTRDPEVIFYKERFKDMQMMNPAIQQINPRNISGRDMLIITSSTLLDKSIQDKVMAAIDKIDHVVVASPLIENLPPKFYDRLVNKYDMSPIGRLSQIPNAPKLEDAKFHFTQHFDVPTNEIGLLGKSSSASTDPMIFNGGLYDTEKNCKGVLGVSETDINPFIIGLSCKRTERLGGGRISILGTEWSDLKTSEDDKQIPVKWFDTLLNEEF